MLQQMKSNRDHYQHSSQYSYQRNENVKARGKGLEVLAEALDHKRSLFWDNPKSSNQPVATFVNCSIEFSACFQAST